MSPGSCPNGGFRAGLYDTRIRSWPEEVQVLHFGLGSSTMSIPDMLVRILSLVYRSNRSTPEWLVP